ncbi:hypothetical protein M441DRAFT_214023 [Trichoderma asperellum CBS 433.97]|uniref:Uncharacterized protein n=1 Tax=Trichoderma asperellum (strain ATCC 204424 / CBS 433.97 / NBRC 101777) TaxID=1042311 RepID=A0A2T3ZNG5_TRIA4|nr:hypothetical protein M441DRAFT_214023 [Trichoderma asperellum CBS 433.97]PTB46355.1 hypothetical protein M441DRAFT_214023 [Trichoderma asperellum CBS 433.97]
MPRRNLLSALRGPLLAGSPVMFDSHASYRHFQRSIPCRSHSGVGGERIAQQTTHSCVTGLAAATSGWCSSSSFSASPPSVDRIDQVLYTRFQHPVIVSSLQSLLPAQNSIEYYPIPIPAQPRPLPPGTGTYCVAPARPISAPQGPFILSFNGGGHGNEVKVVVTDMGARPRS